MQQVFEQNKNMEELRGAGSIGFNSKGIFV
jgi:hypothetical protein